MSQSYQRMQGYLQEMAVAAQEIAGGNLTVKVQPRSEKDALGSAFSQMITSLSRLIGQVSLILDVPSLVKMAIAKSDRVGSILLSD